MARFTHDSGFSLIEVLIASILVGMAIAALVVANGAFTMANGAGADLSTAEFLVEQIREMTTTLPVSEPNVTTWTTFGPEEGSPADYDDVDDFDGATFSPPINANRVALTNYTAFSQTITVENLNATDFDQVVADCTSDFVRVTVQVSLNTRPLCSASWVRARY